MQEHTQDTSTEDVNTSVIAQAADAGEAEVAKEQSAQPESAPVQNNSEDEARKLGWRPKEEFDNPEKWVDAKEYLYRRELMDKIHNQNRNMKRMNEELETYRRSIENVEKIITRREELARQQERETVMRERREAIQNGDIEAVERLDEKISHLKDEPVKKTQPDLPPETRDWLKQHESTWFNKNSLENIEMMDEAARIEERFCKYNPNTSVQDVLDTVEKEIRRKYPHRFKNPNLERKPEVEASGEYGSAKKSRIDMGKVTPALKTIAEQFVRKGLYKSADEYYKEFFGRQ
jgi:hypothetical protein